MVDNILEQVELPSDDLIIGNIETELHKKNSNNISYSRIRQKLICDFAEHITSSFYLRTKKPPEFRLGIIGHRFLEELFNLEHEVFEISEIPREIVRKIKKKVKKKDLPLFKQVKKVIEHNLLDGDFLDLFKKYELAGIPDFQNCEGSDIYFDHILLAKGFDGFKLKWDLLVREKSTGYIFILDFKFVKTLSPAIENFVDDESPNLPGIDKLPSLFGNIIDYQTKLYCYALQRIISKRTQREKIGGAIIAELLSSPPKIPHINDDGYLSKRSVATTLGIFASCLAANNQSQHGYEDLLENLKGRRFFQCIKKPYTEDILEKYWSWMYLIVEGIRPNESYYIRSFGFNCLKCPIRYPCHKSFETRTPIEQFLRSPEKEK